MANTPTEPECVQWAGDNLAEVRQFLGGQYVSAELVLHLVVKTPEGTDVMTVPPNGWLRRDGPRIRVQTHELGDPPLESIVDSLAYEGGFD